MGSNRVKSVTEFNDVIKDYKTDNTQIGIDVSKWQGDIDFRKLKKAGVEFVIIRVGSSNGINGENFVDSKFIQNIKMPIVLVFLLEFISILMLIVLIELLVMLSGL